MSPRSTRLHPRHPEGQVARPVRMEFDRLGSSLRTTARAVFFWDFEFFFTVWMAVHKKRRRMAP